MSDNPTIKVTRVAPGSQIGWTASRVTEALRDLQYSIRQQDAISPEGVFSKDLLRALAHADYALACVYADTEYRLFIGDSA